MFAVFLPLFRASGGRFERHEVVSTVKKKITQNGWPPEARKSGKNTAITQRYTCQVSRLRRDCHACGSKTPISRLLTPAFPFLTPGGKVWAFTALMRRSIRKFNIPPGNPPGIWTFEDWIVQIPSPRGKEVVQMPHQLVLNYLSSKTNFVFNQTLNTLFREIYRNGIFKRFLKTLFERVIH